LPYTALFGSKYIKITNPYSQFLKEVKHGNLPTVAYVDPAFTAPKPLDVHACDDHPNTDIRNGQVFLRNLYNQLSKSPIWNQTLLIITYDEWGGFFDHVPPPYAPISKAEQKVGNDGLLGIRVPCMLLGPHVKKNNVCNVQFDHNSILNLISWRFGLKYLGIRGESSNNLIQAIL
jgi:phospholipase C